MRLTFSLFALIALVLAARAERQVDLPSSTLKSRVARHVKQQRGINDYQDMLLSNVYTHTYYDKNGTNLNRALTCKSHSSSH